LRRFNSFLDILLLCGGVVHQITNPGRQPGIHSMSFCFASPVWGIFKKAIRKIIGAK
jgi:hypothetical protein